MSVLYAFNYPFMIYQCSIVCEHEIQRDVLLLTVCESFGVP